MNPVRLPKSSTTATDSLLDHLAVFPGTGSPFIVPTPQSATAILPIGH